MKSLVRVEHEILEGYLVHWQGSEGNTHFAQEDKLLIVFSSEKAVEDYYQIEPSQYTVSDVIINDCLKRLSESHHVINEESRNHFLDVYNLLDDAAHSISERIEFEEKDAVLDLLNDYVQISVDATRYKLISRLVENINIFVMGISQNYILVEED